MRGASDESDLHGEALDNRAFGRLEGVYGKDACGEVQADRRARARDECVLRKASHQTCLADLQHTQV